MGIGDTVINCTDKKKCITNIKEKSVIEEYSFGGHSLARNILKQKYIYYVYKMNDRVL